MTFEEACRSLGAVTIFVACWLGCGNDASPPGPTGESSAVPPEPLIERYENDGTVCLSPGANEELQFHVLLDDCASHCSDVEASCSAVRQDGVIDLLATGEAINPDGHLDCPDRCLMVVARCSLAGLPPGPYTLRYGAQSVAIELPISVPLTQVVSDDEQASCARVDP